jgi:hypothetical protein
VPPFLIAFGLVSSRRDVAHPFLSNIADLDHAYFRRGKLSNKRLAHFSLLANFP